MLKNYFLLIGLFIIALELNAQSPCSLDNSFNTDGRVISDASRIGERIIALPDGSALVAYNPFSSGHAIVRHVLVNGSVDNTYGTSGKTTIQVASLRTDINALLLLNNELYICGSTGTGSNTYAFITKLKSDGLVDASFGNAGLVEFPNYYTFNDMVFEPGTNKMIVAGMKSTNQATITRLHTSGFMDASFANLGSTEVSTINNTTYYQIDDLNLDKSNNWIITGKHYTTQGSNIYTQLVVMRFNSNGLLDNSFDTDGKAFYNSAITGSHEQGMKIFADVQNEYYICAASYQNGSNWNYALLKIKNDGSTQNSFGTNGWKIYDLTNQAETEVLLNAEMLSNGNILMTGNQGSGDTVHFALFMVKPDGSRDLTFAPNGLFLNIFGANNNSSSSGLSITSDGKIYLSGYTRTCTGGTCGQLYLGVARYFGAVAPNSVYDIHKIEGIKVYPNPMSLNGQFKIDYSTSESFNIHVTNIIGEEMNVKSLDSHTFQILNVAKGVYLIRLEMLNGQTHYEKLIVD